MGLGSLVAIIGAGLSIPQRALAAYMAEAFAAKDVSTALNVALRARK